MIRILFILFGLFELYAAYGYLTATPASLMARLDGLTIDDTAMGFATGFGAAIATMGAISLFGAFVRERIARIGMIVPFIAYNALAAVGCFTSDIARETYFVAGVIHSVFTALFLISFLWIVFRKDDA